MIKRPLPEAHERALSRRGTTFTISNAAVLVAAYVFASYGFVADYGYHPLIVALAIFTLVRMVLYSAEFGDDVLQWIKYATWGVILLALLGIAYLNQPLLMQRMFTFVPLAGVILFAVSWRYGQQFLTERGDPEDLARDWALYRREQKVSLVSAACLVVMNELAIATGSNWIWILTLAIYMVVVKRLLILLVP